MSRSLLAVARTALGSVGSRWALVSLLVFWASASAAASNEVVFDFTGLGTFTTPTLTQGALTIVGSADVSVLNLNGIGVVGGVFNETLDGDEFLDFTFSSGCFGKLSYFVSSTGNLNGNATGGDAHLEAFGCNGQSLGQVGINGGGAHDFSALFPNQRISRFKVTADGDNQRISEVSYVLDLLDIDRDAQIDPLTDMLLLLRYTFGFRGSVLINGAVGADCTRCTAPEIEAYIAPLMAADAPDG